MEQRHGTGEGGLAGIEIHLIVQPGCTKPQKCARKSSSECRKQLTGQETEPWEIIYSKVYKSLLPVIEQALQTAGLFLGSDKSRGYCPEMICADFLAGANLESANCKQERIADLALHAQIVDDRRSNQREDGPPHVRFPLRREHQCVVHWADLRTLYSCAPAVEESPGSRSEEAFLPHDSSAQFHLRRVDVVYGAALNPTNCMIHAPDEMGAMAV
jgi:hypothetical protein